MDLNGWNPDPFGTHEERLFKQGEPTPVVRDNGVGSYDEPPASLTSAAHTVDPRPPRRWRRPKSMAPPPPPPTPLEVVAPTQTVLVTEPFAQAMPVQASPTVPVVAQRESAPSREIGKDRSPASVVGLSIITLGIYYLVWYHHINAEIRRHDPEIKVTPGWSVVAAIFPVANVVSAYCTAARIRQMQLDEGQSDTISPVVALVLFMFVGIGYPLYIASQLREHWHAHRRAAMVDSNGNPGLP